MMWEKLKALELRRSRELVFDAAIVFGGFMKWKGRWVGEENYRHGLDDSPSQYTRGPWP